MDACIVNVSVCDANLAPRGRRGLFVVDRVWHGWPDPPEFAFFALDAQKRIVTGHDFDMWPDAWTRP